MQTEGRQGDILLRLIEALPEGEQVEQTRNQRGELVIAEGETTGHLHAIADVEVKMISIAGDKFVVAGTPFTVSHDEHNQHHFAPGIYEVLYQSEFVEEQLRQVLD